MTRTSFAFRRSGAVALLLLAATGCSLGLSLPTEPVTADQAVGRWKAADCKASLDVARDGVVLFANFPYKDVWSDDDRVHRMSGEGTWTLDEDLDGSPTFDFKVDRGTRPLQFAVRDDDGELVMLHLVGDPDNWDERCVFTRRGDLPTGDGAGDGPVR